MAVKTNTEIVDYIAPMKSISAERDIVLLQADDYRGLFSIGTDNKAVSCPIHLQKLWKMVNVADS